MNTKKIIFVIPWYGKDATGGAETLCKTLVEHLHSAGMSVEVFTTCSREFHSDWINDLKPGTYTENGVTVHRFQVEPRNTNIFNSINRKILSNIPITEFDESQFFKNNINSSQMMNKIKNDEKTLFVFIPYLYGTTFYGSQIHPKNSIMIPCLHDEGYSKMKLVKKSISEVGGIAFNSNSEKTLAQTLIANLPNNQVIGVGVDTNKNPNPDRFKQKYNLDKFILCSARKDPGKNTPLLIEYFCKFLERNNTDLKLVLTGKGHVDIPKQFSKNILDLFLSKEELYDAFSAATIFCLPSTNESFSIVLMESWLYKIPVLVHENCTVTKEHCLASNGGLYFSSFEEFEGCVKYYLDNPSMRDKIGKNGENYVLQNFSWDKIIKKYSEFFNKI